MNGWFGVVVQLIDYLWKASATYAQTPQGQKELNDIAVAWEVRANSEDNAGTVGYSASAGAAAAGGGGKPQAYPDGKPSS